MENLINQQLELQQQENNQVLTQVMNFYDHHLNDLKGIIIQRNQAISEMEEKLVIYNENM